MIDTDDPETILEAARAMIPELRERAAATEANRKLLPETHEAFLKAGFYRVMQPRGFGGLELPFGIQTGMSMELARACPSSAWVAGLLACHGWLLGMMPGEAQEEVWGGDPETCVATSFAGSDISVGRASGGYRISGRWPFSSGVDYCRWAILVARLPSDGGSGGELHYVVVPLEDCRIVDTWNATGLAGTGSNDIAVGGCLRPRPQGRAFRRAVRRGGAGFARSIRATSTGCRRWPSSASTLSAWRSARRGGRSSS